MYQIRISQHGGWLMVCSNEIRKSGGLRSFHRLDSFFVRDRFVGHISLLQNSIYNLLFQHNRTDFVHLLVVFVIPGHDLLRLLVSRGHFLNHFAYAGIVRLELELLDHFCNDQAQHHTTLGLLFEQLRRQLLGLDVATELLHRLHAQTIDFVADQGLGHFYRVGSQQAVHHLIFHLGLDGLTQFALHILAHFGAEAFQAAFLDAELSEELVIELRQLGRGNAVHGNRELGGFAGQVQVLVVLREYRIDHPHVTGLGTDQGIFEARDHAAGAQHQLRAGGRATREGFAVDLASEIDIQLVAIFGSTLDHFKTGVLLAQNFQHIVQIGISHIGLKAFDGNGLEASHLEFREDFEGRDVLQVLALLEGFRLDGRRTRRIELLLDHGLIEGSLNQVAQGFLTSGVFVALTNDAHRHLARTEASNFSLAGSLLQTLVDFSLDALDRNAHGHATLKSRSAFNRNLHGYSSLHRHRPAVCRPRIKGMHSRGSICRSHPRC